MQPTQAAVRHAITRVLVSVAVRAYVHVRVLGRDRLPAGPHVLCFSHQSWADPFMLIAVLPWRPRLFIFGPLEEDMRRGLRNRLIAWSATAVPSRPDRNDLRRAAHLAQAILDAGGALAIAGEGRIHLGEGELLPLWPGAAHFALRARVPLVPVAVNGTGWLRFGGTIRVRIGDPIRPEGPPTPPTRRAVEELTERAWQELHRLEQGYPDVPPPGPFGRWFTELFNDWPEGSRPTARIAPSAQRAASGPPDGAQISRPARAGRTGRWPRWPGRTGRSTRRDTAC